VAIGISPTGSTERDASGTAAGDNQSILSILNPSADDISVDINVVALNGDTEPTDPNSAPDEDTRTPSRMAQHAIKTGVLLRPLM